MNCGILRVILLLVVMIHLALFAIGCSFDKANISVEKGTLVPRSMNITPVTP